MALSTSERKQLLRSAKQRGVVVQSDALKVITEIYTTLFPSDFASFIEAFFKSFHKQNHGGSMLSEETSQTIFNILRKEQEMDGGFVDSFLTLIDAVMAPVPRMNPGTKQYTEDNVTKRSLVGTANDKTEMLRRRFELILERTLRDDRFSPEQSGSPGNKVQLTELEALRRNSGKRTVLGFLSQLEEGGWFLEDFRASIQLDLSDAILTPGIHTDGSIVLARGKFIDSLFKVETLGSPSAETRDASEAAISRCDLFGPALQPAERKLLEKLETENSSPAIVFLSDVWLDNSTVWEGLQRLLGGLQEGEVVPQLIVMMGNFNSPHVASRDRAFTLLKNMTSLGNLISKYRRIASETEFVFVPGPEDPGAPFLPKTKLPTHLFQDFSKRVKKFQLMSNPCRLRFYTKEILLFREDLLSKMTRHSVRRLDPSEDHTEHLVKSVVDQAHLFPLPLTSRPISWSYDHSLWLFPSPNLLVLADKEKPYLWTYNDCQTVNPSSFAHGCTFSVYIPSTDTVQQTSC